MTQIERGTTYRIEADVKDSNGTLVDPDQSGGDYLITITISNTGTGTVIVDSETMTRDGTGEFHYDWQTTNSLDIGQYDIEVQATVGGNVILNRDRIDLVMVK